MMEIRKSADRGQADHGWLRSAHTFSFADYHDPRYMSFGPLRVINEDRVQPGKGFGTHAHRDMEIISYVLSGALEHKDSLGTGSVLHYGDVQRMSAGSGVQHSEFNPSPAEPVHFLQIWIMPNVQGVAPSYEEKHFDVAEKVGRLRLIASPDGTADSVLIHQDAYVHAAILDGQDRALHQLAPGRKIWLQVARGALEVNGVRMTAGDGMKSDEAGTITLEHAQDAEVLLFDLP